MKIRVICGLLKVHVHSYYYSSFSCFFAKVFPYGLELPYDILCTSRSDDNRRADGGLLDLQQSIMSRPLKTFSTSADVCEALYYQCILCNLWLKISCFFVSFRGSKSIIWLRFDRSKVIRGS